MLNKFTIGLNETQVGLTPPTWLIDAMKNTIGGKQTEFALTAGTLFETEEALKIGLVDEVAQSKHEAIEKAEKFLNKFKRIPPHARSITKAKLRGANIQALVRNKDKEVKGYVDFITDPQFQDTVGKYIELKCCDGPVHRKCSSCQVREAPGLPATTQRYKPFRTKFPRAKLLKGRVGEGGDSFQRSSIPLTNQRTVDAVASASPCECLRVLLDFRP
ncbi:hypothetical protein Zmor_007332 [Zophobas morio]|uniref:Uncharacterized protein n=1 Tax=Zophobas morio TaxID=2755281 RepID=A0AA38MNH0_9CUCU|nr:hypothetical protein Zmor_007332 [Zophobas morio]